MTIICWDGKTLAADKRMTTHWGAHDTVTKIGRARDGALYAIAGKAAIGLRMLRWWQEGATTADFPKEADTDDGATLVIVLSTGDVAQFTTGPIPTILEQAHSAFGSGRDFATAAMHLGCDARRAVEVAIALCTGCGNGIDTLELNP